MAPPGIFSEHLVPRPLPITALGPLLWSVYLWPFQTWTFAEGFLIEYVNYGANLKPSWEIFLQFSSVAQSCPTLCDPLNCSIPGLPVLIWQKKKGAELPQGSPDLPLGSRAYQNNLSGPSVFTGPCSPSSCVLPGFTWKESS